MCRQVKARHCHGIPFNVDMGGTTRAGRAKSATGQSNQDAVHVARLDVAPTEPESMNQPSLYLAIVTDGVTHSRVGDGQEASQIACKVLTRILTSTAPAAASVEVLMRYLTECCLEAGERIVAAATQQIPQGVSVPESDMMSTTALIGLLRDQTLYLANVGDSRAYLIVDGRAEQLTVDGDVGCDLLASGVPPEEVQEMGPEGRALRYCLGACRLDVNGSLQCDTQRCAPIIASWPLRPGDIVLLCSDGLIEEGVFLHPEEAAAICNNQPDLSAQALAERLADAADARQREPSPQVPGGFGDNITCVILKITPTIMNNAGSPEHG